MVRWAALLALIAAPSVNVSAFTIKHSTLTLSNGFRVILAPDRSVPVAAMAMLIPVGARQETKGRSGFAHLFEHLMFDGSAHVKKGQFDKILEGLGAESNASTHMDMTFYYESVPSNALPVAFWLDADRMSELRVFKKNMRNQIEVVKEEKRLSVFNEPYMPLLWVEIQKKIFSNSRNQLKIKTKNKTESFNFLSSRALSLMSLKILFSRVSKTVKPKPTFVFKVSKGVAMVKPSTVVRNCSTE
ncbi:MAG: hypothetical protein COB53_08360 [Elusimicrobia bacterium]|nr:MAG: hypothetical protein COB53_08360 [Elusimicrobiota bacterium]